VALVGTLLVAPARTEAQQPQTTRINYVNADLADVIRSLGAVLGVNVVLTGVPSSMRIRTSRAPRCTEWATGSAMRGSSPSPTPR